MWVYLYPNNTETPLKDAYIWRPNPTSIVLDKSSINLVTVWQTEQLTATIKPVVCDKTVTWSSNDTTVATVDQTWLVTCVTPWNCTITATTVNGLTASCSVGQTRLPSAYQEVEWIWSSRTQVINTWVIPATQTYTAELEVESTQSGTEYWAFGIWGTTGFRWWQDSSWHWDTSFGASYEPSSYSLNTKTKITMSNAWKWTSSNTAIWLFWMWENRAYPNNRKWAYKIYYCKIWNSWTLIRDFVPCYRISDNVIWMYDLENDVFYTNNWSWTFTKWNDVN